MSVHYVMFLPALMNHGTSDQQAEWISRAWNCNIIGTYAQTELGHGTFLRGLETTSTYDPSTKEFVIHSPTITAYKVRSVGFTAILLTPLLSISSGGQEASVTHPTTRL